jgi:dienelactone hydrolase
MSTARADVPWLPPGLPLAPATGPALCPAGFITPTQGAAVLAAALTQFPDRASWDAYAAHLRNRIQEAAGLAPWPKRTPLNAIIRDRREHDGYTVENVAFESAPGVFVTGNLYRPLGGAGGKHPVILSTHGHANKVVNPADYDTHARFSPTMQTRCANLARMGAIVFAIDMFAYGEGIQLYGQDAHRDPRAITIQVWNGMRALDFLLSLEGADPTRVAVSGESGGGTQTILLTALDPRVTVSAPVVMVSAHFFGGCPCESGVPIHRGADYFASPTAKTGRSTPRAWNSPSCKKFTATTAPQTPRPTSTCPTRAMTTARRSALQFIAFSPRSSASTSSPRPRRRAPSTRRASRWNARRRCAYSLPISPCRHTPCTPPPPS